MCISHSHLLYVSHGDRHDVCVVASVLHICCSFLMDMTCVLHICCSFLMDTDDVCILHLLYVSCLLHVSYLLCISHLLYVSYLLCISHLKNVAHGDDGVCIAHLLCVSDGD